MCLSFSSSISSSILLKFVFGCRILYLCIVERKNTMMRIRMISAEALADEDN